MIIARIFAFFNVDKGILCYRALVILMMGLN